MKLKTPAFWYKPTLSTSAKLLRPLGWLYAQGAKFHRGYTTPLHAPIPVISVGNITVGGTGKTPLVGALAKLLEKEYGHTVAILSRGYGRRLSDALMVLPKHTATDVGDEPLEMFRAGSASQIWVGPDRFALACMAAGQGATIALLDDGFQHHGLHRDLDIVVIDGRVGLGNRLCLPAGPLREDIRALERADILVMMNKECSLPRAVKNVPQYVVRSQTRIPKSIEDELLVLFAGIGLPQKFFDAIRETGAKVLTTLPFADHHTYTDEDKKQLRTLAQQHKAKLLTTAKDAARLPKNFAHIAQLDVNMTDVKKLLEHVLKRLF